MNKRVFRIQAIWDAEAGVFYSEGDIKGLHIEAADMEEFEAILMDTAPDLIAANHMDMSKIKTPSVKDLMSTIVLNKSEMAQTEV